MGSRTAKFLIALACTLGLIPLAGAKTFVTIGSGSTTGLYYPTAVGMAKIVNDANINVRANARSTGASVFNCRAIGEGQLQMGFTQNNVAYYAYKGEGVEAFQGKPVTNLRGLAILYPEVIHILARKEANIQSPADFKDKRIYVGDIGSGTEQDAINILEAYGLGLDDLKTAVRGSAGSAVNLLRDGQIDAMFYTVGVGASAITEAAQTAPISLVPISDEYAAKLHNKFAFYTPFVIPGKTYPDMPADAPTITLSAMLVVDANMSDDDVYAFMDTLFNKKLDTFYNDIQNPNLKEYFQVSKALEGMPIPVHPGAIKFYEEQNVAVAPELKAN
ncbi:TAXI family TRAP transporter solute-binding subunit [Castellaniella sp.]|uniref:TAXI family TRAP transporter solute-binding subunit n=1 Tax=Castellaniella sp. TaxID=1955812 RepID=UPI003561DBBC